MKRLRMGSYGLVALLPMVAITVDTVQGQGTELPKLLDPASVARWVSARNSSWDRRLRAAGESVLDCTVTAWFLREPSEQLTLVLSQWNLGAKPLRVYVIGGTPADILVRNKTGKPADLTINGIGYYSQPYHSGSQRQQLIQPGDCNGMEVYICDHYELNPNQDYTVLPGLRLGTVERADLIAKPLQLKAGFWKGPWPDRGPAWIRPVSEPISQDEPIDLEWRALRRSSGERHKWCVLKQLLVPGSTENPQLAVSLTCVDRQEEKEPSLFRREATSYKLIVRDPDGRAMSIDVEGASVERRSMGTNRDFVTPKPGDGIGAILPLLRYKQFAHPGKYWVMATLSDSKEPKVTWVAEPTQVDIGKPVPKERRPFPSES
jgi:hypothetical protein